MMRDILDIDVPNILTIDPRRLGHANFMHIMDNATKREHLSRVRVIIIGGTPRLIKALTILSNCARVNRNSCVYVLGQIESGCRNLRFSLLATFWTDFSLVNRGSLAGVELAIFIFPSSKGSHCATTGLSRSRRQLDSYFIAYERSSFVCGELPHHGHLITTLWPGTLGPYVRTNGFACCQGFRWATQPRKCTRRLMLGARDVLCVTRCGS